ncbi:homoserine dehydrogenase [Bacillus sp. CHD6a]|uniref:homoserine dehydrogenase n=1 Tax=Bacillus sp. CHD6a TaxID=1643452 RepID=UPI0006CC1B83|nr:homoserine dehydrogenase [Bacillus sp. CHD6a]KPB04002.1 homoserine dehydrogenase [Bacillus sp. CHD6a]
MSHLNIAILGFGTVGKGVHHSIKSHQTRLEEVLGKSVRVVGILVKNMEKHEQSREDGVLLTTNYEELLEIEKLDVIVDAIVGCEPGRTYLTQAIEKGIHVVTANKEMFAHHGEELLALAKKNNVTVGFEATVAGGIPVIQTLKQLLQVNRIQKVEGIFNGTSNFILSSMRKDGLSFEATLLAAQENGYAETDPSNDIEGYDAFYKAVVLSQLIYGEKPEEKSTIRKGITEITADYVESAAELGLRFRHIVTLFKGETGIQCKVEPVLISTEHPFYQVDGVQNAVSIETDLVGNVQLQGPGAGRYPTASAILEDIIQISRPVNSKPAYIEYQEDAKPSSKYVLFSKNGNLDIPYDITVLARFSNHAAVVEIEEVERIRLGIQDVVSFELKGNYRHTVKKVTV